MTCDLCGQATATQVITQVQNGKKSVHYYCDACQKQETHTPPKLNRPCATCKQREGEIKFVRQRPQGRVVTYICEACVSK